MWVLETVKDIENRFVYILPGKGVTFGRKLCDVVLHDDGSISRLHALVTLRERDPALLKTNEDPFSCIIIDKGSKYGTVITQNNKTIHLNDQECLLKDGDVIRFGLQSWKFSVRYTSIVTMASSLHDYEIDRLKNVMDTIGGIFCDTYSNNCTHLTVSKGVLTQKVVWAMASGIPVVTMKFWAAMQEAMKMRLILPKPETFAPVPGDNINRDKVSYSPNDLRKTLFKQKTFIHFTNAQLIEHKRIIELAGGMAVLYNPQEYRVKDLCAKDIIVLQYPISDVTQSTIEIVLEYNTIYEYLRKKSRRMISENEIALALLHCSIDKFCNPAFCFSNILKRSETSVMETHSTLVYDTQDVTLIQDTHASKMSASNVMKLIPETNDFSVKEESEEFKKPTENWVKLDCVQKNSAIAYDNDSLLLPQKVDIIPETLEFNDGCSSVINEVKSQQNLSVSNVKKAISEMDVSSVTKSSDEFEKPRDYFVKTPISQKNRDIVYSSGSLLLKKADIIPETVEFNDDHPNTPITVEPDNNTNIVKKIFLQHQISESKPDSSTLSKNKDKNFTKLASLAKSNEWVNTKKSTDPRIISESDNESSSSEEEDNWIRKYKDLKNLSFDKKTKPNRDKNMTHSVEKLQTIITEKDNDHKSIQKVWNKPLSRQLVTKTIKTVQGGNSIPLEKDNMSESSPYSGTDDDINHSTGWISYTKYKVNTDAPDPMELIINIPPRDPSKIGKKFKKQEVSIPAKRLKLEDLIEHSSDSI